VLSKIPVTLDTIQCGQSPNLVAGKAEAIRLPLGFSVADARKAIAEKKITDLEGVDEYLRG
jgi:hypothetical protein